MRQRGENRVGRDGEWKSGRGFCGVEVVRWGEGLKYVEKVKDFWRGWWYYIINCWIFMEI